MKFNAFKVSNELTIKIDSAPVLNEFMKSQTSLPFFNNEEYFKTFIQELQLKKIFNPGFNYFSVLQNFINKHFEDKEKYLKFLKSPSLDTCEQCPKPTFIVLKCHKIAKPMFIYSTDGYHYLPRSKASSKIYEVDVLQSYIL